MQALLTKVFGGPVGRLRYDMVEMDSFDGDPPEGSRPLRIEDLPVAAAAGLLAKDRDHAARLARGDHALIHEVGGDPAGIVWLNVAGHDDSYGGAWTRPDGGACYLNQLMVVPAFRGRGIGRALVRAARVDAHRAGRTTIRSLVQPDNAASHATFASEGARVRRRLIGLRLGRWSLRLLRPPTGGRHGAPTP